MKLIKTKEEKLRSKSWALKKMVRVRYELMQNRMHSAVVIAGLVANGLDLEINHIFPMLKKLQVSGLQGDRREAIDAANIIIAELRMMEKERKADDQTFGDL